MKAPHLRLGQEAWGYVVSALRVGADTFYVPTRYPNSHAEGAPHDHYGPLQSEEAIRYAREILAFVRAQMAGPAER